ncbi:hypothetical protein [Dyadobacter sediminis]|uniref:hypothetical protein n=1 Tax=Dyadobacter sediminis TaxID=1493691 RepID=UPI001485C464|nr:hypothetical protein [Dyadobacter sediminis]GGB89420.1 hypothetical protein GCM10011325_16090 [Dyadobacter sediminis]
MNPESVSGCDLIRLFHNAQQNPERQDDNAGKEGCKNENSGEYNPREENENMAHK